LPKEERGSFQYCSEGGSVISPEEHYHSEGKKGEGGGKKAEEEGKIFPQPNVGGKGEKRKLMLANPKAEV